MHRWGRLLLYAAMLMFIGGCSNRAPIPERAVIGGVTPQPVIQTRAGNPESYTVFGKRYYVKSSNAYYSETGIASWYGCKFHGKPTALGETYDMYAMTAAHKTLRIPTYVEVTNLENGRVVTLRVNDRGPFVDNRIIDLSYAAAKALDMVEAGTAMVHVRVVEPGIPAGSPAYGHSAVAQPAVLDVAADGIWGRSAGITHARWGQNVYIQIGAFAETENRLQVQRRLSQLGFDNIIVTSAGPVERVRLGPIASLNQFDDTLNRLRRSGFYDAQMVVTR
ncbi:MAG TPA: septal ring lytic transglycosylase RlpA family protein [Halothiobacillaceae bacterium]|nr:septal ring lytic transglycosylase RlpA family protein [Halothiobacillaceae bacterium]